ncbi:hypothetical protein JI721_16555 [Alicyclobacillus cycloheptanicus]|uniref:Uncharacterized protein n=1 Tax=Alicyclobacillus cycloheptanicus TaxID=1457 RepID=A0ABT9XE38_9BACL|nr:hypothetical protein [Alicyclobacillus cycloheptanicus]MDQ0188556.1 hypothetical protein [Alicyclobacillus cycloheptanicus]WDM01240.1 hypothetical protein JI721_16555 [Alicyclobacillus cycloheptanicus]
MRFSHLTPHQFQSVAAYVDTLVATAYTPAPLDIAVPHEASAWISDELAGRVSRRFSGRVATVRLGAAFQWAGLSPERLDELETIIGHPHRFGVLITERHLLVDHASVTTPSGAPWLVIDWWQWFRKRVPKARLADAWMYLAHAHAPYMEAEERRRIGMDPETARAMAAQGQALLEQAADWTCAALRSLWASSPAPWDAEDSES